MKKLTLSTVMLIACFISFAQQKKFNYFNYLLEQKKQSALTSFPGLQPNQSVATNPKFNSGNPSSLPVDIQAKLLGVLPNGNKLFALPQDNMACIVPDMKEFAMPVLKPVMNGSIPNGSNVYQVIPQ